MSIGVIRLQASIAGIKARLGGSGAGLPLGALGSVVLGGAEQVRQGDAARTGAVASAALYAVAKSGRCGGIQLICPDQPQQVLGRKGFGAHGFAAVAADARCIEGTVPIQFEGGTPSLREIPGARASRPRIPVPGARAPRPRIPVPAARASRPRIPVPAARASRPRIPVPAARASRPRIPIPGARASRPRILGYRRHFRECELDAIHRAGGQAEFAAGAMVLDDRVHEAGCADDGVHRAGGQA